MVMVVIFLNVYLINFSYVYGVYIYISFLKYVSIIFIYYFCIWKNLGFFLLLIKIKYIERKWMWYK